MNKFKTVKEFNDAWEDFIEKERRQRWHMPSCPDWKQKGMAYTHTARFEWIVETFKLWEKYKKTL